MGKTVIRPEDNPFTDAELAGAILWGMTFYDFTKPSVWSPREEHYTKYGEMAQRLERKLYLPFIRDKRVIREHQNLTLVSNSKDIIAELDKIIEMSEDYDK